MRKKRGKKTHPWYKRKKYLHFDFALKIQQATNYVTSVSNIEKHNFSPLIRYTKKSRQYKLNKDTKQLSVRIKPRHIFYSSHVDGYVYAYYSYILGQKYEEYLQDNGLTENVLAYRAIRRGDQGASNIHFAQEAFNIIQQGDLKSHILCLDIKGFFDNIDVGILKKNWARILSKSNAEKLPNDHYNVFYNLTNFRYIQEYDIINLFQKEPRKKLKINRKNKEEIEKEAKRTLYQRICDFKYLKEVNQNNSLSKKLIKQKSDLKLKGIPQGTPISGMLSNIFMIDFDLIVKSLIEDIGGSYRRYSDDILLTFPSSISMDSMINKIENILQEVSNDSIRINSSKTEKHCYLKVTNDVGSCYSESGEPSKVQYLGFVFDGEKTYIRSSSMSKNCSRIASLIIKSKQGENGKTHLNSINTRQVYKAQSPRKITQQDKSKRKGFARYAEKAADIHESSEITEQIRKRDKVIKNKILEERMPYKRLPKFGPLIGF